MPTASGHSSAICARKVIGTSVLDAAGQKIGVIEDIVLDKTSSNVMFAIVGFGGFLGMAEKYHPIPWSQLDYESGCDGYVSGFTSDQLKAAPYDSIEALTTDDGRAYRDLAFAYYHANPYWG